MTGERLMASDMKTATELLTPSIVGRERPADAGATLITAAVVQGVFRRAIGGKKPLPELSDYQDIAVALSRPWREGYKHGGPWQLRSAIRVILDDAPRVLEAERGHKSPQARAREQAWLALLAAAQAMEDAGVRVPDRTDVRQKNAREPAFRRDREFAFNLVAETLKRAGWKRIGTSARSEPVIITCNLLGKIGIIVEPAAISKDLGRRKKDNR